MFVISQPYPSTDPNLPTSFTVSGLPGGDAASTPVTADDGSVTLHHDLGDLAVGTYNVTVKASNVAGTSDASNVLDVVIAPPIAIPTAPVIQTSET